MARPKNPAGPVGRQREIPVPLACGCVLYFPSTSKPKPDELLWCRRHGTPQAQANDCRIVKCKTCQFVRNQGTDKTAAHRVANQHAKRRNHEVEIWRRGKMESRHGTSPDQTRLDDVGLWDPEPPF